MTAVIQPVCRARSGGAASLPAARGPQLRRHRTYTLERFPNLPTHVTPIPDLLGEHVDASAEATIAALLGHAQGSVTSRHTHQIDTPVSWRQTRSPATFKGYSTALGSSVSPTLYRDSRRAATRRLLAEAEEQDQQPRLAACKKDLSHRGGRPARTPGSGMAGREQTRNSIDDSPSPSYWG